MPRTRNYSKEEALEKAMHLFWSKGYHDTSMEELVSETGVSRYSFYELFQNKKQLFLEVLDYYYNVYVKDTLAILEKPEAALPALEMFFQAICTRVRSEEGKKGCFVCNTAIELAPHDPEVAARIQGYWEYTTNLICSALQRGQQQGQVREDLLLEGLSESIYAFVKGLMVLCRVPNSTGSVTVAIETVMKLLQPPLYETSELKYSN